MPWSTCSAECDDTFRQNVARQSRSSSYHRWVPSLQDLASTRPGVESESVEWPRKMPFKGPIRLCTIQPESFATHPITLRSRRTRSPQGFEFNHGILDRSTSFDIKTSVTFQMYPLQEPRHTIPLKKNRNRHWPLAFGTLTGKTCPQACANLLEPSLFSASRLVSTRE